MSCISLGMIVLSFDPFLTDINSIVLFYVSLFAAIWSWGTVLSFCLGRQDENRFGSAFKKGFLISVAMSGIFLGLRWLKM